MVNWAKVLDSVDVAKQYFDGLGVRPTLRTLFYHLYSKGLIQNNRSNYSMLSRHLVDARKEGRYRWDFLEDKTRMSYGERRDSYADENDVETFQFELTSKLDHLNVDSLLKEYFGKTPIFYIDKWAEQPIVPEIWIEKEALSSTIQAWTDGSFPIRVCRGYPSWTFLYDCVQNLKDSLEEHEKVVILYLGDYDYHGIDIERFIGKMLNYFGLGQPDILSELANFGFEDFGFSELFGKDAGGFQSDGKLEFKRLAVTEEQINQFNLPRDPMRKDAVELDALVAYAPNEFKDIVQTSINNLWDKSIYDDLHGQSWKLFDQSKTMLESAIEKARNSILVNKQGDA